MRIDTVKDLGFNARITLCDTKKGKPREEVPLNSGDAAIPALEPDPASSNERRAQRGRPLKEAPVPQSLDGLTPEAGRLDQMTHKMSHSVQSTEDDKVPTR